MLKQELKETTEKYEDVVLKYDAIRMYIGHYKLGEHFLLWINSHKEDKELPPPLRVEDNG